MNILQAALEIERMSIKFYSENREKVEDQRVQQIFKLLAEEEKRHEEFIMEMFEGREINAESVPGQDFSKLLSDFRKEVKGKIKIDNSVIALYAKGMAMEQKSIEIYTDLLLSLEEDKRIVVVKRLLKEEGRHKELMEEFLDLARNSEEWVESPEFSHIGDNY